MNDYMYAIYYEQDAKDGKKTDGYVKSIDTESGKLTFTSSKTDSLSFDTEEACRTYLRRARKANVVPNMTFKPLRYKKVS